MEADLQFRTETLGLSLRFRTKSQHLGEAPAELQGPLRARLSPPRGADSVPGRHPVNRHKGFQFLLRDRPHSSILLSPSSFENKVHNRQT